ncbi:hypothetical protein VC83_06604 [Pseudogymnoascus destructans]|uniref:RING-type domain-containing protein n=1 Tax=Pseudogymnoascus destructans TaxID=655981 RepID=A0A177A9I0_9PEZI|nr:uncharacterized protein VC83_06604 [Pseudogymnoascus destructans]OAF58420.2 hypothetical protein VC83_06604 [Pseudogymnoascus destructans]
MAVDASHLHAVLRDTVGLLVRAAVPPTAADGGAATSTTSAAADTATTPPSQDKGGSSQSPLLFFVALGFGVVFTNLWIIVGVKYCFRYNARNRALARGEIIDPISMERVHPRPHRRRREKKLMTVDEVNERFPRMKYSDWAAARAHEGLPTAGGVSAPAGGRPATLRDEEGVQPTSPTSTKHFDTAPEVGEVPSTPTTTTIPPSAPAPAPRLSTDTTEKPTTADTTADTTTHLVADSAHLAALTSTATNATHYDPKHPSDDSDDEDLHVLPPALLDHPGDSCAICIDVLEPTDDVRGLTCGHAFHASCLDPWLTSRRACCPLCKADYYIPKPRTEGEEAETREREREHRRRERAEGRGVNLPHQPGSAWVDGRVRGRFFLPARFGDSGGRGWPGSRPGGEGESALAAVGGRSGGRTGRFFPWHRSAGASGTTPAQLEAQIRR